MKKIVLLFCLLLTFPVHCIEVIFINPSINDSPFWQRVEQVATSAAKDLNIEFKVYNSGGHRLWQKKTIDKIINQESKPDYIIFLPYDGTVLETFTKLEQAKIPFITIERTTFMNIQTELGQPRGKFKFWLGEIYHNNKKAGQLLANALFKASEKNKVSKNNLNVIGISGEFSGQSNERNSGLIAEIEQSSEFSLAQIVNAHWDRELASHKFTGLLKRYDNTLIVWTAADIMALGVADIAKQNGKVVNKNLFIGGFDWDIEALKGIEENTYTASVGGHFMQVGWALVKIYDHNKGKQAFNFGNNAPSFELQLIDRDNISDYKVLLNGPDWDKVNFSQFSMFHQTDSTHYQFDFAKVLAELNNEP